MKKLASFILLVLFCLTGISYSAAAAPSGYFENTRTVLLLPAVYQEKDDRYAAYRMDLALHNVFRYPYYRTIDSSAYENRTYSEETFRRAAEESGADIAVLPVVAYWNQITIRPLQLFFDADPVVQTRVNVYILSWKKTEGMVRRTKADYFDVDEESTLTDPPEIMNTVLQRLMKRFPYRRVPNDVETNLSGTNEKVGEKAPASAS